MLVLLYIIIELFGIQSHGFLSVVLVLFSFSCCRRGFTACATGYVYYIMFFPVVFRFMFRARVRCCLLGSCVRFLGTFWGRFRCFACFFFCYGVLWGVCVILWAVIWVLVMIVV